ncbi:hypothetical protein A5789_04130 [Nocardia sp. 852002-51101_SCH5132738]|nr:hypothetical protein A5789_04130 [Nocardia sp. 852002-51101_SCH5132738]OBF72698.1 hypothetical protein A9X06_27945 [Mycobacterium sp. 852002-51759_SCH5129042]
MSFIENEEELVSSVGLQPLPGLVENWTFDRAKQHVFQHRIVRDQNVWRGELHFVTSKQLSIIGSRFVLFGTGPCEPGEVLGRPAATVFQLVNELVFSFFELPVVLDQICEPAFIAVWGACVRVRSPPCIHAEVRVPAASVSEVLRDPFVAE